MIALPSTEPRVIEGVVLEDNREERFVEIANAMVEQTTEYSLHELPEAARDELVDWVRGLFHWACDQRAD